MAALGGFSTWRSTSSASSTRASTPSTNVTVYQLRMLAEERASVHPPAKHFQPRSPMEPPDPLKARPALALSSSPPPVAKTPFSPVNYSSSLGFSRSSAGLPWGHSATSLTSPDSSPRPWTPFKTEYSMAYGQSFYSPRVFNNHRQLFDSQHQSEVLTLAEERATGAREFGQPFQPQSSARVLFFPERDLFFRTP